MVSSATSVRYCNAGALQMRAGERSVYEGSTLTLAISFCIIMRLTDSYRQLRDSYD